MLPTGYEAECVRCPAIEPVAAARRCATIECAQGPKVTLDGREVLLLCSNDYLGLAGDPRVARRRGRGRAALGRRGRRVAAGQRPHGASTASSRSGSPSSRAPRRACCSAPAILANTGVVAALATDGVVASDALNHASIIDGCRLARARTQVYAHGEIPAGADVIVTDAVFSMDGDVAPICARWSRRARA